MIPAMILLAVIGVVLGCSVAAGKKSDERMKELFRHDE